MICENSDFGVIFFTKKVNLGKLKLKIKSNFYDFLYSFLLSLFCKSESVKSLVNCLDDIFTLY